MTCFQRSICLLLVAPACQYGHRDLVAQSILVDQLGYRPTDAKIAMIRGITGKTFHVMNLANNRAAFSGKVRPVGTIDENTGDTLYEMDFTKVRAPGRYQIWMSEISATSPEFTITDDAYRPAALAAIQSYYYQRCGTEVNNGTPWNHPPCHLDDATVYANPSLTSNVVGGWHDAGDYGKFVATGAVSAEFLLSLYESQPGKFSDGQLQIPERNNSVPDILDEARWELEWLLKMQGADGGVSHKVSTKKWTGEHLPDKDPDRRYLFDVSSTATGSFCAITAAGARVFKKWDSEFARRLLRSSLIAWKYLELHPSIVPPDGFHNPPGVEGGEYGDAQDRDERLWASAELYRTTLSDVYHRYFLVHYMDCGGINYPVSWEHVQNFAYYSYLSVPAKRIDYKARSFIIASLTTYSDDLLRRIAVSGYRCVLTSNQFYWGSNSVALGYAYDLIHGYEVTGFARYLAGAVDQLHYIFGRNTFGQTFVTGIGSTPVRHPYHQFSMLRDVRPVPGLLVGGPNKNSRLNGKVLSKFSGKCYEDSEKNYYVNEVAINYTAPLAFVAGYFARLDREKGNGKDAASR